MKKETLESKKNEFITSEMESEKHKSTLVHYDHVLEIFISSLKSSEVTKRDVIEFKEALLKKYKPSTTTNYLTVVNKFLKFVRIDSTMDEFKKVGLMEVEVSELKKKIRSNSIDKSSAELIRKVLEFNEAETLTVKNIKVQQRSSIEEMIEPIEYKRLLRIAKKYNDYESYMIMKILSQTGIRVAELKAFTLESIQSNYIQVNNKGKIRRIILRNDLRRELVKHCKLYGIDSGFVFPGKKEGAPLHDTTIWKRLKKIAGKAKVRKSKVHAHSFRHLFAVQFLQQGGQLTELSDILGHSSVETTKIYVRTTDEMKRKRLEKMKF